MLHSDLRMSFPDGYRLSDWLIFSWDRIRDAHNTTGSLNCAGRSAHVELHGQQGLAADQDRTTLRKATAGNLVQTLEPVRVFKSSLVTGSVYYEILP